MKNENEDFFVNWKPLSERSDEEMAKVLDAIFKTNFEKEITKINIRKMKNEK